VNKDFPRVITLLRKERNISQKKAAADLGVSQALLSHYEKGIRECGLDFIVKAADYYGVSCDYLLGRSPEPQGRTISYDDIEEQDSSGREHIGAGGMMASFNKKLIVNSLNVLFSLVQKTESSTLMREVSAFLMLSVYRMFRKVYSSNTSNDQNFFTIPEPMADSAANAAMALCAANAEAAAKGIPFNGGDTAKESDETVITSTTLSEKYPALSSSILNIIKNSEAKIKDLSGGQGE